MSIDVYEIPLNDYDWDIDYSSASAFDSFKKENPSYLENLKKRISILYEAYDNLSSHRHSDVANDPEQKEIVQQLGFGLLMRHALEAISVDLARNSYIEAKGKTAYERLTAIRGQTISGYTAEQEKILFHTLECTNGVAHPHLIGSTLSHTELENLYRESFRPLIQFHMQLTKAKNVRNYLAAMMERLDNFKIRDVVTRGLALGNLTRHLVECVTNLWGYNNSLVPTDASTKENEIKLSRVLMNLRAIAKGRINTGFGSSVMTLDMLKTLVALKNASNPIMHVNSDEIGLANIKKHARNIEKLRTSVNVECSPLSLEMKMNVSVQKKKSLVLTTYCGLFGGLGIHHFYAGNIAMGVFYLLTFGGFFIGPIASLVRICCGTYKSKKWGMIPQKHKTTIALAVTFIALRLGLFYLVLFR